MLLRPLLLSVCLLGLLCQPLTAQEPSAATSPALTLWQRGQEAMRQGHTDQAIDCYRQSLRLDPTLSRNFLSLAAAFLEKGEDQTACPYLARYVAARPDHSVIRYHYAELLYRLDRPGVAREQLERFVADAQEQPALADQHLIACHSRLMEIAQAEEDGYAEHLHRGIGLYLLACQRSQTTDGRGELGPEPLFCKAAAELTLARLERPEEARPCWYLHETWTRLGQRQPASQSLRAATDAAPFSYLTPAEQRRLQLASRHLWTTAGRK